MNHNKVIGTYKSKKGRKVELIQNDGSLEFGVYCYGPNNYHILWDFEVEGIPRFGKSKKEDWIKAILDGRVDKAYEKDESRMDRNIYSAKGFEFDSLKKDSNMKIKDRDYIEIKSPSDVKKETVNFIKREYKLVKRITCKKTYPGSEAADFEVDYYDMRLRRWDDDKIHLDYEFDDSTADKIDKMTLEQANTEFKKLNNEISKLQGNIIYEDKSLKFDSLKKDSNMKIKDESLNSKIKAWFLKAHPEEEYFGKQLNANATFQGLYETIKNKQNVYNYIGLQDSVVREYIFQELADILHQNYQMIYKMWLGDSMKDAKYDKETKQGFPIIAKYIDGGRIHVIAKRARDYIIGLGYDENSGTWNQGRYDLPTFEKAENALFEEKGKLRRMGDSLKRYKIGNRIITADSPTKALEIHKLLDSKVKDGTAKDIVEDLKSRFPGIQLKTTSMGDNNRHYILVEVVSYANNNENSVRNYLKHLADKYKSTHSSVVSHSNEIFIQDSKIKDAEYYIDKRHANREARMNGYSSFKNMAKDYGITIPWENSEQYELAGNKSDVLDFLHDYFDEDYYSIEDSIKNSDSISDSKVEDSDQTDIFNEIKSKYPGVKFVNVVYEKEKFEGRTVADFSFNIIGNLPNGLNRFDLTKKEPFERFVKWVMEKHGYKQVNAYADVFRNELRVIVGGFKSIRDSISDESIEELSEEEKKAIEDYKKAIAETNDPKMLKLFAHILKEETEHLEELQTGEMEDSIKD